jgi:hypothetical protein
VRSRIIATLSDRIVLVLGMGWRSGRADVRLTALLAAVLLLGLVVPAWADHGGGLRAEGWSPLTAALVFGGLALLVGAVVVILVTVFSKRNSPE